MKHAKGFTLIELMIVVVIVAILASIAIPSYTAYVTRGKIVEATGNLAGLRVRMEQYFQDNRSYQNAGGDCGVGATPASTKYFTYACASPSIQAYTITATGRDGMAGFAYTIDQSNLKQSAITASGWNNPNPNNCWATKSDGSC